MAGATDTLKAEVKTLADMFLELNKGIKSVYGPMEKQIEIATQLKDANVAMLKAGGDFYSKFSVGGEFNTAIDQALRFSSDFFGSAEKGSKAFQELSTNMTSFYGIAGAGQFQLAKTATLMQELGFEAAALGKALDNQAMAFGANQNQLQNYAALMHKVSRDLYINPKKLLEDFGIAQTNFAYNAEKTMDVFVRMEKQSRKTGLEFSTMAKNFGEGLDTFQGATEMAGKLNAILNQNMFNPLELLGMDEATRVATIRSRLQQQVGTDLDNLGKFELKAIGTALGGMSPLDVRKFLTEGGDIKATLGRGIDERAKSLEAVATEANMKGFADGTELATNELLRMEDTIRNTRTRLEDMVINFYAVAQKGSDEILAKAASELGLDLETARGQGQARLLPYIIARLLGGVATGLRGEETLTATEEQYNRARQGPGFNRATKGSAPDFMDMTMLREAEANPIYFGAIAGAVTAVMTTLGVDPRKGAVLPPLVLGLLNQKLMATGENNPATDEDESEPFIMRFLPPGPRRPLDPAGQLTAGKKAGKAAVTGLYAEAEKIKEAAEKAYADPSQHGEEFLKALITAVGTEENARVFSDALLRFTASVLSYATP